LDRRSQIFKGYPDVLSVKDIQSALNIGKAAAYRLLETGQIHSFRIGRVFKVPKNALVQYINNQS